MRSCTFPPVQYNATRCSTGTRSPASHLARALGDRLSYRIDFEPVGRRGDCPEDLSILEAARHLKVELVSLCDGQGTCGHCKVQIVSGEVSPPTEAEQAVLSPHELQEGFRLACQAYPRSDLRLRVPPESLSAPQRTQVEGLEVPVAPEPLVRPVLVTVARPALADQRSDTDRIAQQLHANGTELHSVDIDVLRQLSPQLRAQGWQVQLALRGSECVGVTPTGTPTLGLAVDVGTTKVAGYLVDLENGRTAASQGIMNPQIAYGEDVITRINRVRSAPAEAQHMQDLIMQALDELARNLCTEIGAEPHQIVDAVVVGNTAMHHLLLRLPAEQLALAPYVACISDALDVKARDLGLMIAPGAYVHLLPNVAGYVGADHVAMLLAIQAPRLSGTVLALDIGTNTEVCLIHHGEMSSVSCASGPAFEGAHIKCGMRAAAGAIESLRLVDDRLEYHTVGGAPPAGLCGSGILDVLAQLHLHGIVDRTGKMGSHPHVHDRNGQREFVLVPESTQAEGQAITLTQHDVRELQLAKGAMRTGIQVLLEINALQDDDIGQVIIAGAFGSYINVASAIAIGMLPPLPLNRFRQVGNAAGTGARLALISRSRRLEAQEIGRRVRYVELGSAPRFSNIFAESMYLGEFHFD